MVLRNLMWRLALLAGLLCGLLVCSFGQSDDTALNDRLQRAAALTSLDDSGLEPWHLKMQVQLYDLRGKPKEKGTVEEWWSGPKSYRIVYLLPSYTDTELTTEDGNFSSHVGGAVPYYVRLLRAQVVHPIRPTKQRSGSKIELSEKKSGAVELELLSVYPALAKDPSTGYHQTYCFEKGKDILLFSSDFPTEAAQRTKLGRFQGQSVALGVRVEAAGRIIAEGQVDELKGQSLPYPETKDLAGLVKGAALPPPDGLVEPGKNIKKVQPVYPSTAKQNYIQGSVVFSALITESGKIESLEVISSPDESLTESASEAVKQWTYSPYLVDGTAVKVETLITVNFSFSMGRR